MNPRRIGSTLVYTDGAALVMHCQVLRNAWAALMLAFFGGACSVIAIAAMIGLLGAGADLESNLLAIAFAGVLVLPLFGIGTLFIAVAIWTALNSLTTAVATNGLRTERRWCGIVFARKTMSIDSIVAIDSVREARFNGIFSGVRNYRLRARSATAVMPLADHLQGGAQTAEVKQLLIDALGRAELASSGRSDHHADENETRRMG